jgi:hypothetical protein
MVSRSKRPPAVIAGGLCLPAVLGRHDTVGSAPVGALDGFCPAPADYMTKFELEIYFTAHGVHVLSHGNRLWADEVNCVIMDLTDVLLAVVESHP